jgi:DNA-binding YbaB/EbfC family protein
MGKGMRAGKKKNPAMRQKAIGGGGNQAQQMAAFNALQAEMDKLQDEINDRELETSAGGGAVNVKINGKKEILELKIDPDAMDPSDPEMLQDLIITAVNEAIRQVEDMTSREMGEFSKGLGLPQGML